MLESPSSARYGEAWTRDESILAFELYCRIPFQQTKANNPEVKALATVLGRTPASVARKLGNFGAFDPALQRADISGLTHTSKLDGMIWKEFHNDWNGLVWQAHELRRRFGRSTNESTHLIPPEGPSETVRMRKVRIHQAFFRDAILSSYDGACCVTGLAIPKCLIASHIVPWSKAENLRTDPTNGVCLSATFDRLFEEGLMTITPELRIRFSSTLARSRDTIIQKLILTYDAQEIRRPNRFLPDGAHLAWHQKNRFQH
jgi:putative restriction endonuclease